MLRRQFRERGAHRVALQLAAERLRRVDHQLAAVREQQPVQLGRLRRLGAPVASRHPPRAVARNRAEPAGELRRVLQLRQRLEGQQECLLRHVARRFPRAERLLRDDEHRAAEAPHQFVERLQVAE